MWIYTHIGYLAGQNIPHLHWHLCVPPSQPAKLDLYGQAILLPRTPGPAEELLVDQAVQRGLAEQSSRLLEAYNQKCNNPDYCLFFGFHSPQEWFVGYTPILINNNWGGPEFAVLDCGTPFSLPWPHSESARYLRG